jgi:hypothetical protein
MQDCEYAPTDAIPRYLTGKLEPAEAERFEEHSFACDRCWTEVEVATAIRARTSRAARRSALVPLSLAASVVILSLSAWLFMARRDVRDEQTTTRGASVPIHLSISQQDKMTTVRWKAVPNAASYAVSMFDADGTLLRHASSPTPAMTIPGPARGRTFVRVDALDASGHRIGTSSLQPFNASQ